MAGIAGALALMVCTLTAQATEVIISVPGIPGPYCAYGVEKRLLELDGVQSVAVFWQAEEIRAELGKGSAITELEIKQAVEKADYPYDYTITIVK